MSFFKKYKSKKEDDGTYCIEAVPIFSLGKHRGFNFDKKWGDRVVSNYDKEAKGGYYPSVIIGHNDGKTEKPSYGHLRNLKVVGNNLIADLFKITSKTFKEIKDLKFPHRSIEVYEKAAKITALALLGGTTPFHKLPIMEIFSDEAEAEILFFSETEDDELEFADDLEWDTTILEESRRIERRSLLGHVFDAITSRLWALRRSGKSDDDVLADTTTVLSEGKTAVSSVLKKKITYEENEEGNMPKELTETEKLALQKAGREEYREQYKGTHGVYPEEMGTNFNASIESSRKAKIVAFCEKLKNGKHGENMTLAPAIVDEFIQPFYELDTGSKVVKFADKEYPIENALEVVLEKIIEFAAEGKLFVDMSEHSEHSNSHNDATQFDENVDEDEVQIYQDAEKMAADKGITLNEAIDIVSEKHK